MYYDPKTEERVFESKEEMIRELNTEARFLILYFIIIILMTIISFLITVNY